MSVITQAAAPEGRQQKPYKEVVKSQNPIHEKYLEHFSLAPSATLSFHKENSVIAEGLVLLMDGILEPSELGVLCFCCWPSGATACAITFYSESSFSTDINALCGISTLPN